MLIQDILKSALSSTQIAPERQTSRGNIKSSKYDVELYVPTAYDWHIRDHDSRQEVPRPVASAGLSLHHAAP